MGRILVGAGGYNGTVQTVDDATGAFTVTSNRNMSTQRILDGITVRMLTSRAMARFQTVPDWYELPPTKNLAIKIIGNGVPCELARRVYRRVTL